MDALLQVLQTTQPFDVGASAVHREDDYYGSIHDGDSFYDHDGGHNFAPQKKGSYVEPGMEHLTTNLFVGNLDPMFATKHSFTTRHNTRHLIGPIGAPFGFLTGGIYNLTVFDFELSVGGKSKKNGEQQQHDVLQFVEVGFLLKRFDSGSDFSKFMTQSPTTHRCVSMNLTGAWIMFRRIRPTKMMIS